MQCIIFSTKNTKTIVMYYSTFEWTLSFHDNVRRLFFFRTKYDKEKMIHALTTLFSKLQWTLI